MLRVCKEQCEQFKVGIEAIPQFIVNLIIHPETGSGPTKFGVFDYSRDLVSTYDPSKVLPASIKDRMRED